MSTKRTNNLIVILLIIAFLGSFMRPVLALADNEEDSNNGDKTFTARARTILLRAVQDIDNWVRGLIYFKEIQEENNVLVFQNRALKSLLIDYHNLKSENELLREALKIHQSQDINFLLANVIGRSPLNFSQTFVIDVGEEDGIKVGQSVVWGGKTLIGEIIDVRKNSSTVRAITDSEFRAAVFVGEGRTEALFTGNGFLPPFLDLVPTKEEIALNEQVYTSGLDNKFIRGLYVGDVSEINKPEGKIFQEIKITPALDWTSIYQVLVIVH